LSSPCDTHARAIDRHFAGRAEPQSERAMREHLATCAACEARYRRHLLLAALDPQALPARERIAIALGVRRGVERRQRGVASPLVARIGVVAAPLAIAATIAFFVAPNGALRTADSGGFEVGRASGGGEPSDFTARGGARGDASRVYVYRVTAMADDGPAVESARVDEGGEIPERAELAFAYRNPEGYERLMVFAVDEAGRIYWFHPAWTHAADDPRAIAIAATGDLVELREAVRHPFAPGRLWVHTLFLREGADVPSVRAIEQLVGSQRPGEPVALPDARTHVTSLTVARSEAQSGAEERQ
jgi:hypothetical protein